MVNSLISPEQILRNLLITEPEELDLLVIAASLDATVVTAPLKGMEASIVGVGNKAIITVNENSNWERQRFSIGHELGHWCYDRGKISFSCDITKQTSYYGADKESLANKFSKELLLPSLMLMPRVGKRSPILETVCELAVQFKTSITATASRIVELSPYPAMLICSSRTKREWFKGNQYVENILWPHQYLSKNTLAYGLFNQTIGSQITEEIDSDAWIDHIEAADYVVVESSMKITSDNVISILWWRNQSQILDTDADNS